MSAGPSSTRVWGAAIRPKTLPAAVAPVLMGAGMAVADGVFHLGAAVAALIGAILLQVGTNFANDYFDFVNGADTDDRLGPARATQQGLVTPAAMKRAFIVTFVAAIAVGVYLVARGGWPIVAIGLSGVAAGVLYTGGPRPLGYMGLGDILVFVFFGPVAVAGTYFVQAQVWSASSALAGIAPGALATALLAVNNLRDVDTDRDTGKNTLAVRLGPRFAKAEYVACLVLAAAVPIALWAFAHGPITVLAASFSCLVAIPALNAVVGATPGDRLLAPLAATGRLLAVYGVVFTLAMVWGGK